MFKVESGARVQVVSHQLLRISPGPRQPADFESFLHPIAQQLDMPAHGISGVRVAGLAIPHTLHAYVLQFTTDMPGGNTLLTATGHNGAYHNRFRDSSRVLYRRRYYFPPENPFTGARPLCINGHGTLRRSAASIAAIAASVEAACEAGESEITIQRLTSRTGIKGYSLFFTPSLADRKRYPNLSYLWSVGPFALQYEPMHLVAVFWRARSFGRDPRALHDVEGNLR